MKRGPRRSRDIEHNGESMHVSVLAERTGIPIDALWSRWQAGDRGEKLVRKVGAYRGPPPGERGKEHREVVAERPRRLPPDPQFDALLAQWNKLVFGVRS
jgi:hypothetical protein